MRVLIVAASYWPALQFGGPVTMTHGLARALVELGVNLSVITTDTGIEGQVTQGRPTLVDDVPVTYHRTVRPLDVLGQTGWQFSPQLRSDVRRVVRDYDVVHIMGVWNYPAAAAAGVAKAFGTPYVVSPHGTLYPYTIEHKQWKKRLYKSLVADDMLASAAAIHYLTADEFEQCHAFNGLRNPHIIVPGGVAIAPSERRLPNAKAAVTVLFLGRLHWIKGLDVLVDAMTKVCAAHPAARLVLVGPDEGYEQTLRAHIGARGLNDRVTLTGMVRDADEKARWMAAADVFVLPSRSEGFSVSALEGAAAGLPMVVSEHCRFPEVASEGAGFVVPLEPTPLAEAIGHLVGSAADRHEMGLRARRLAEQRFAWPVIAQQFLTHYRQLSMARRQVA